MGKFLNGLYLGIGIGLLIAPMSGEELRRRLVERFQNGSSVLSGNQQTEHFQYSSSTHKPASETAEELRKVANTALEKDAALGKQASSLVGQPYTPAYPEYVDPEATPGS